MLSRRTLILGLALIALLSTLTWVRLTAPRPSNSAAPVTASPTHPAQPRAPRPSPPASIARLHIVASARVPKPSVYGATYGIPILMFHRLELRPQSPFALTPTVFRRMLTTLREGGYCAVTLSQYLTNSFAPSCAGRKPVALTFDDSHPSQVALLKDGSLDPDSVLGALRQTWPEARATFFANVRNGGPPFGRDSLQKIALLEKLGFEIGNHTVSHARLDKLSAAGIATEISGVCRYFKQTSMLFAYPYGVIPHNAVPTNLPGCAIPAAFGADSGYFEGGYTAKSGRSLLAPLPGTPDFTRLRLRIPRLNISNEPDLKRDLLENPDVYTFPLPDAAQAR